MPDISRVTDYVHLTPDDLVPPGAREVFFEPADTEIGVWVVSDLLPPSGGGVLDLGSGSGAAAAAMARAGAARVHGIDSGEETLAWAREHHARPDGEPRVTFALGDFARLSTEELLATAGDTMPRPLVVTSNPPYVPMAPDADALRPSISGGPDGLKWAGAIIGHGRALGSDLGLTFGSYSSPRRAVSLLEAAGYRIAAVTLSPLPLGDFTLAHPERVSALEKRGEAVLWRPDRDTVAYFVVGLACRRAAGPAGHPAGTGGALMELLRTAACSRTTALEALDGLSGASLPWPVRVLDLPPAAVRHHW
ncbi:methyltransferase domain-containing protein [Streptomyces sp. HMX112]|uniref:methyltransferase domain-containing protein n=1 Tax=Streptomyces sp. HMX112 TaxID=3390850 RepID=UPI003A7FD806